MSIRRLVILAEVRTNPILCVRFCFAHWLLLPHSSHICHAIQLSQQFWLQVLGGAGPAIAAVPLTVVWVGGSFVSLLTGIGAGKVGPVDAAQRVGYVFFMSVAQVSVASITTARKVCQQYCGNQGNYSV